jgi:glycosyltransferase involved in cell wall biosynthesis
MEVVVIAVPPFISVVLPTYNRAGVVGHAIQSVLEQEFADFELIVVDDRSTDSSLDVLRSIAAKDARVRVVTNDRTKGEPGARNSGIDRARGTWLCQIDSDDLWAPGMLGRLAEAALRAPEIVGVVYGSHKLIDRVSGELVRERIAEISGYTYPRMLEEHFFYQGAAAMRLSIVRAVGGYDELVPINADTDFQIRVTERCEVLPVPEAVYLYLVGGGDQLSRDNGRSALAYETFFKKHASAIRRLPKARYSAALPGAVTSIRARMWGLAFRNWVSLLPLSFSMPRGFLHSQKSVALELVNVLRKSEGG